MKNKRIPVRAMHTAHRHGPQPALRPIALGVMLALASGAFGNPTGPSVAAGAASFQSAGKTLSVTNALGTIINWQSFSIGSGEHTRFQQQSAASAVLNRVVGNDGSSILGALSSNGRVFLVNPHGIIFGANARIDTAGFIASTLNMADRDFLEGRFRFEGGGNGLLRNEGEIRASGDIMLVGPTIENAGLIRSEAGSVLLAAGKSVTITSPDAQGVKFEVQAPTDSAVNLGTIEASSAAAMFAGTLEHSGEIRAVEATVDAGGRVVLVAQKEAIVQSGGMISANGGKGGEVTVQSGDLTSVAGNIEAKGSAGQGGNVQLLGNRVAVQSGASVDVSGETAGGTILVGGDYQGKSAEVQNAWRTYVGEGSTMRADAVTSGDGGRVIVWADDTTRFYGNISARGGAQSGNGGLVETSGKQSLSVVGARVHTLAPAGRTGTWLLDPKNIRVVASGGSPGSSFGDLIGMTEDIDNGAISGSVTNVVLQANNNITFIDPIENLNAGVGLTAQAGKSIFVQANIVMDGDITLSANDPGAVLVDRDLGAAQLTMNAGTLVNSIGRDVMLRMGPGAGMPLVTPSGDITVAGLTATNVNVLHDGPTEPGRILRANAASLLTGTQSVYLQLSPNGVATSIGDGAAPIRIATPALEANVTGGAGGIFIEASGDLGIGGALDTLVGPVRGVQALAGGPIEITATGNLTRNVGTGAGCGASGGSGGPICTSGASITLNAASIGGPAPSNRVYVGHDAGGAVQLSATTTTGGIFVEKPNGDALLSNYALVLPVGQPIELGAGNGRFIVDASIAAGASPLTLFSGGPGGEISFSGGVNIGATLLTLQGTGPATFNTGTVDLDTPVTASVPVNIGGATVNFNGATSLLGPLTVSSGTLDGAGTISAGGGLLWTGGTIASLSGVTVAGVSNLAGGALQLTGTLSTDALSVTGGSLEVGPFALLQLTGAQPSVISNAALQNFGQVQLAGPGSLVLNAGTSLVNDGIFDIQGDADVLHGAGAPATFTNNGVLRKAAGIGTSTIGTGTLAFSNPGSGLISASSGTLEFAPGSFSTNEGVIDIDINATLAAGDLINAAGGLIGGLGTLDLAGATLTNNGRLMPGFPIAVGTLAINGNLTQGSSGSIDIRLAGTGPGSFDTVAVTGHAALDGTLNVTHVDGFNPPSNSVFNVITFATSSGDFATRNVPPAYVPFYSLGPGTGTYVLALGDIVNSWAAAGSGTWEIAANWSLGHAPTSGEDAFIDVGGPGVTETITVSNGNQNARRVASSENLSVTNGIFTLGPLASTIDATFSVSGSGSAILNGPISANSIELSGSGVISVGGAGTLPRLTMTGGFLTRSNEGDLTILGPFAGSGGVVSLSNPFEDRFITAGVTTITAPGGGGDSITSAAPWRNTGTLHLNGELVPSGGSFTNAPTGTLNVNSGGRMDLASAQLSNEGTLNINTDAMTPFGVMPSSNAILNTGTLSKNGPDFVNLFHTVSNTGTGRINLNGGTLSAAFGGTQSGRIEVAAGAQLNTDGSLTNAAGGLIGGNGSINLFAGTLTNDGTVRPGVVGGGGTLTLDGSFTNNGTLDIRLGGQGPTQFGSLNATGTANLGGTLALTNLPGYTSPDGDTFTIVTAPMVAGNFGVLPSGVNIVQRPNLYLIALGGPTVNSWIFDTSGNWTDATRWSLAHVPLANEQVFITRPTDLQVTIPAGPFAADSLQSKEMIVLDGTLSLAKASSVENTLQINAGGMLQNAGAVTLTDLTLAGTLAGTGGVTVTNVTGLTGNSTIATGARLTASNAFLMAGGGTLNVAENAELNLTGVGEKRLAGGAVIVNAGTMLLAGPASLSIEAGSSVSNGAAGILNLSAPAGSAGITGAGTLANAGTLNSTSGAMSTLIAALFNNTGTVNIDGGTLRLTGDGTDTGLYAVDAGTILDFGGGTRNLNAGSNVTGAGTVAISGATVNVNGGYSAGATTMSGGTVNFNTDVNNAGAVSLSGGTANVNAAYSASSTTISGGIANFNGAAPHATNTLNFSGGTLGGTGGLTVNTGGTWSGGSIADATATLTIANGAVFALAGAGSKVVESATIVNAGTVNLAGAGNLVLNNGAAFSNGGVFDVQTDGDVQNTAGAATFANAGTLRKSAGAGISTLGTDNTFAVTNAAPATIDVQSGVLQINGGLAANSGAINLESGATLSTGGAALTNNGTVRGAGTLDLAGATLTNNAIVAPGTATDATGTLAIGGNLVQGPAGRFDIELGGMAAGQFDAVTVSGNAALDGALNLATTGAYAPASGDTFNVLTAGSRTGFFATTTKTFANEVVPAYAATSLTLQLGTATGNTWIFDVSDSWNNPQRWSQGRVPLATDQVVIDRPNGLFTITVPAGPFGADTLAANENVTINGTLDLARASTFNATLAVTGGTLQGAAPVTVNGTLALNAGTIANAGGVTVNGSTGVSGVVSQLSGNLTTDAFSMPSGGLTVAAGGILNLIGTQPKTIAGATLTNSGTTNLTGTADTTLSGGALWDNFGTLNLGGATRVVLAGDGAATLVNRGAGVMNDTSTNATPIFVGAASRAGKSFMNAGRFTKAPGSADVQTLDVPMTNTGSIEVLVGTLIANGLPANSGIVDIRSGATFSTAGLPLTNSLFGLLKGNGTLALGGATFTNNGTVSPGASPGMLTIAGNYVQGPGGTLAIELGGSVPGTDYDALKVSGSAALDGTLVVTRSTGAPIVEGSAFEFMTYASATGDFSGYSVPQGFAFQTARGPTSYTLTNSVAAPPEQVVEAIATTQNEAVVFTERVVVTRIADNTDANAERRTLEECR